MTQDEVKYLNSYIVMYDASQASSLREDILKQMNYNKSGYYDMLKDIKNNGQKEPVIEVKGQLIDGWKRVQALVQLGLPIKVRSIKGINEKQTKDLYMLMHPPTIAACKVKDKIAVLMEEIVGSNGGYSTSKLAKELKVSTTTVKNCKNIYNLDKNIAEAMANGQAVEIKSEAGAVRTTTAPSSIVPALQDEFTTVTPVHAKTVIKNTTGLVYAIKDGEYTKIGVANNVDTRIKRLQTGNPRTLEIVDTVATATPYELEAKLHGIYEEYAIGREWFKLPEHIELNNILKDK